MSEEAAGKAEHSGESKHLNVYVHSDWLSPSSALAMLIKTDNPLTWLEILYNPQIVKFV